MIPTTLLNNETDLGVVEQTKFALAILKKISERMTDPNNKFKKEPLLPNYLRNRNRSTSTSSDETNHAVGTEGDEEEDSSSYNTAEEDHFDTLVLDGGQREYSDESDDTMKTSLMDIVHSHESSTQERDSNVKFPFSLTSSPGQGVVVESTRVRKPSYGFGSIDEHVLREISIVKRSELDTRPESTTNLGEIGQDEAESGDWLRHPLPAHVGLELKDLTTITTSQLQRIFNCFKNNFIITSDSEFLLETIHNLQKHDDFQWALHQLGGFNAILFLYGRVVEICENDELQAKCLSLVLSQLKSQRKGSEGSENEMKHLIRFVLNSTKSIFGFKTFLTLVRSCLNPKGNRLEDYQLLYICLLCSWKRLLQSRCTESDAPTGNRTLFECLLQIILDLCVENRRFRESNVEMLKTNKFSEALLSICNNIVFEAIETDLNMEDGINIATTVKSILSELMAPPDGSVAISFIKFGLLPFLPRELPPLPRKSEAFFCFHTTQRSSIFNLSNVVEAEEISEDESQSIEVRSEQHHRSHQRIDQDIPEVIGIMTTNGNKPISHSYRTGNNNTPSEDNMELEEDFTKGFQTAIVEGIMSTLLNSLPILPDEAFRNFLVPNQVTHIFVAYTSHPNFVLKKLSLQLLTAYLTRVKNPVLTEFIKNRGFFLTSLYTQGNPELGPLVLEICTGLGPFSYPLINGLVYSNQVINTLLQWVEHDENTVVSSLLSTGFLPSVIKSYNNYWNQQLPRSLVILLSTITKYLVLNPRDETWKTLFCQGIESAPQYNFIVSRMLQDATEILRRYSGKELKKTDSSTRLLWLIERCSCTRIGNQFEKWLLKIFAVNIMEMDESQETDGWRYFVKKNRRRLNYLMGLFLCRMFATNQGDLDFKQYAVRCLILSCSNLSHWLPRVVRSDDQIERCFTAFVRVFMSEAETHQNGRLSNDPRTRRPSFHSLISTNGNLILTLKTAAAVGLPSDLNEPRLPHSQSISNLDIHLSDRVIRSRFETVLIDAGILSPTNNFVSNPSSSMFSSAADFKTFKILLEATPISGVSHSELRQCLITVEKMWIGTIAKSLVRRSSISGSIKIPNNPSTIPFLTISNSATYFNNIFEAAHVFSIEVLDVVTKMRTKQEIEVARRVSVRDADITAKEKWWEIRQSLIHPKAPWYFPTSYPKFWTLDQTEGPSRVRTRLRKEPLKIHSRFIKTGYQENLAAVQPLDFLFLSDSSEFLNYPILQSEIEFIRFSIRIIPGEELPGEVIFSGDKLYFFCEACHIMLNHCPKVSIPRTAIYQILRRRYTLEDRAAEIFVDSQSYFFVFRTYRDREDFVQVFSTKLTNASPSWFTNHSLLLNSSLTTVTSQWVKGTLSNFDYLMYLNTAAGRTYCDLMQYPVFPFVLAKYDCPTLDLYAPPSYRDLRKPMAIQDPAKENHFVSTYNYLKRECDSTPFHYGSHYSNSGIVLHFLVRLPPYTQHFLKYQDGSFDIPDRSFHSIETTWKLASKDSNTDFKEAIPEFSYLPEFLENLQHFDLGVRQNESRVDDVNLPPWSKHDARIFTLVNRQALESQEVRKHLGDWIDLIFGYKQTGKSAVQAINVFHPSTYEGFEVEADGADEVIQRARRAMVSTYGQTPKRLFPFPHPKSQIQSSDSCDIEVIDTVWGIRWGQILGSPASPDLDFVSTRDYREPVEIFESPSRIVFWPNKTIILNDAVVGSWDTSGIRIKSNIIHLCIGDEITTCVGVDRTLWVGHQSGRISVLNLTNSLDAVVNTVELVGHYQPIKFIDLNQEFSIAVSCSGESYAMIWDMNRMSFANVIEHSDPVDYVYSSRSTGDILLLSYTNNFISLKTINGFPIGDIRPEEKIVSACLTSVDPGRNVNLVAIGCDVGIIKFYSTWDVRLVNKIKVLPIWTLEIKSLRYSRDGRRLYCLSETEGRYVTVALQLAQLKKS